MEHTVLKANPHCRVCQNSLPFKAEYYSSMNGPYFVCLFICQLILRLSAPLAIVNNAAMDKGVPMSAQHSAFNSLE